MLKFKALLKSRILPFGWVFESRMATLRVHIRIGKVSSLNKLMCRANIAEDRVPSRIFGPAASSRILNEVASGKGGREVLGAGTVW